MAKVRNILRRAYWGACGIAALKLGPVSKAIARTAEIIVGYSRNYSYEPHANGEFRVLQALARFPLKTIFDVGANVGDWTVEAARLFPAARVHAFEIAAPTFAKLTARTSSLPNVIANGVGLSSENGQLELKYARDRDVLTSFIASAEIHDADWVSMPARVARGDDYCAGQGINRIDVLKIDVEGAEHLVLEGFSRLFSGNAIDVVQFEYGSSNIYSRQLLRDFYNFFTARKYVVGKIMPGGVLFGSYRPELEDFRGPNYLAVREERRDLIDVLR